MVKTRAIKIQEMYAEIMKECPKYTKCIGCPFKDKNGVCFCERPAKNLRQFKEWQMA